jgi:hypothetical protein
MNQNTEFATKIVEMLNASMQSDNTLLKQSQEFLTQAQR